MTHSTINLLRAIAYAVTAFFVLTLAAVPAVGQQVVDKTVATVSDGVRTELITYSDLLWQLALIPGIPLDPPASDDLNQALQLLIRQRLIGLEAARLPRAPNKEEEEKEVKESIRSILNSFPNQAEFQARLNRVGFDTTDDPRFVELIKKRVSIEKYVDFRFRSFVVITPEQIQRYYRDAYTPDFRAANPGRILPSLEDVRDEIERTLIEEQVREDIERFIDNAEARAEIVMLTDL